MSKLFLIGGAIAVVILLAFFGGMKLGQSQAYSQLVFGTNGEILVRVPYAGNDVIVKRYKDDNVISILESGLSFDEDFKSQLDTQLKRVEGLEHYSWESDGLTLVKIDTARWEKIVQEVLGALFQR